jgi:tetratricopeptide (TPR) repeat protein
MKLYLAILILLSVRGSEAASQGSEFATGRAYYTEGDFKKAAAHFQRALKVNPNDAESYYWMGMSYQVLGDIAFPFAGRYTSKACVYLTRATVLAPSRLDYRRELFDFLLDSAGSSRAALRQAEDLCGRFRNPILTTVICANGSSVREGQTARRTLDLADYSSPFHE